MAQFDVLDMNGKKVSTVELSDAVFGITPNEKAVHAAVVNFLANQRQGTQSTKTRSEVSGGGRKPWRQKGTGHARQGSTRAPQWTHGGVALGPKPRDYSYRLNRKVKRLAILSAISAKAAAGDMILIDSLAVAEYKTKAVIGMLASLLFGFCQSLANYLQSSGIPLQFIQMMPYLIIIIAYTVYCAMVERNKKKKQMRAAAGK